MSVIANNTVLSNFAFANRLDLLRSIFQIVYLTHEVYQEVINGINEGYLFQGRIQCFIDTQEWLILTMLERQESESFNQLCLKLHKGEASCLAIAKGRGWLFLTDDMTARKMSAELNVSVTGTVGILKVAAEQKLISASEGDALLRAMIENGYYSPVYKLSDLI